MKDLLMWIVGTVLTAIPAFIALAKITVTASADAYRENGMYYSVYLTIKGSAVPRRFTEIRVKDAKICKMCDVPMNPNEAQWSDSLDVDLLVNSFTSASTVIAVRTSDFSSLLRISVKSSCILPNIRLKAKIKNEQSPINRMVDAMYEMNRMDDI